MALSEKQEVRRDFIIERCSALFSKDRLERISISDIEAATGLTRGAVYYYFRSKQDIWYAVVLEGLARFHKLLVTRLGTCADDPKRQWLAVGDAYYEHYRTERSFFDSLRRFFFSVHPEADLRDTYIEQANIEVKAMIALLTDVVERGVEKGQFKCDDPELAVMAMWGLMVTTALMTNDDQRLSSVGRPQARLEQDMKKILLTLVGG